MRTLMEDWACAVGCRARRLTAAGISRLLTQGRMLKMVDVSYCTRVAVEHLQRLRKLRPDVTLVAHADWMPRGGGRA